VVPRKLTAAQRELLSEYARSEQVEVSDKESRSVWGRIKETFGG
jgi:hypothetical protein